MRLERETSLSSSSSFVFSYVVVVFRCRCFFSLPIFRCLLFHQPKMKFLYKQQPNSLVPTLGVSGRVVVYIISKKYIGLHHIAPECVRYNYMYIYMYTYKSPHFTRCHSHTICIRLLLLLLLIVLRIHALRPKRQTTKHIAVNARQHSLTHSRIHSRVQIYTFTHTQTHTHFFILSLSFRHTHIDMQRLQSNAQTTNTSVS